MKFIPETRRAQQISKFISIKRFKTRLDSTINMVDVL